jgi:hypothetical protein
MLRYQEREIPDTYNTLISYPEKITVAVLGTQANDYPGTGGRGSGGRIPIIRGWEGTLTIEKNEIVFIPAQGSKKKSQRFAIEHGEDFVEYWQKFLDCCRRWECSVCKLAKSPVSMQTRKRLFYRRQTNQVRLTTKRRSKL